MKSITIINFKSHNFCGSRPIQEKHKIMCLKNLALYGILTYVYTYMHVSGNTVGVSEAL